MICQGESHSPPLTHVNWDKGEKFNELAKPCYNPSSTQLCMWTYWVITYSKICHIKIPFSFRFVLQFITVSYDLNWAPDFYEKKTKYNIKTFKYTRQSLRERATHRFRVKYVWVLKGAAPKRLVNDAVFFISPSGFNHKLGHFLNSLQHIWRNHIHTGVINLFTNCINWKVHVCKSDVDILKRNITTLLGLPASCPGQWGSQMNAGKCDNYCYSEKQSQRAGERGNYCSAAREGKYTFPFLGLNIYPPRQAADSRSDGSTHGPGKAPCRARVMLETS